MRRPFQKIISTLAIIAVLFAQLALSAYACPMQVSAMAHNLTLDETRIDKASVPATDCEDMDMSPSALCQFHCQNQQNILNDLPPDLTPYTVALIQVFGGFAPLPLVAYALASPPAPPWLHRATSPPAEIRNCCFRI